MNPDEIASTSAPTKANPMQTPADKMGTTQDLTPMNAENSTSEPKSGFKTTAARRTAAFRASKSLPKSPPKFTDCLEHLIKNSTPRRKAALASKIKCVSPPSKRQLSLEDTSMKCFFNSIAKKRSNKINYLRRLAFVAVKETGQGVSKKALKKTFSLSSRFLRQGQKMVEQRKKRKDALQKNVIDSVINFYTRGGVSCEMPNTRLVGKRVLEASVTALYEQFKMDNPYITKSFGCCPAKKNWSNTKN
jgi:hypothetical protein